MEIPNELRQILRSSAIFQNAYLVGGCVRDSLLNIPIKDFDIEVFGLDYAGLIRALEPLGKADLVGRSFGVVKLRSRTGEVYDFSLPRRDSKVAPGHKGFEVELDEALDPFHASARRDFTINSMMIRAATGELIDCHGGERDLRSGTLRHTSAAFAEDPLRVLRGFQFVSRFKLDAAPETVALCKSMVESHRELPVERVREEWVKWAVKSVEPARGLQFLADTGWLQCFPELLALRGTPQDPRWHPEGDVWIHTGHCCNALAEMPEFLQLSEDQKLPLMLAVLSHDLGKPLTTQITDQQGATRISSPGHESSGVPVAESFLARIGMQQKLIEQVLPLVQNHMVQAGVLNDRGVRRLSKRLEPATIADLCLVMKADRAGRPPKPVKTSEDLDALLQKAKELTVEKGGPRPLLQGRDLIARGLTPGPNFKVMLDAAYEAQLDGLISSAEEAEKWLKERLAI